jgi:hypothetical protein
MNSKVLEIKFGASMLMVISAAKGLKKASLLPLAALPSNIALIKHTSRLRDIGVDRTSIAPYAEIMALVDTFAPQGLEKMNVLFVGPTYGAAPRTLVSTLKNSAHNNITVVDPMKKDTEWSDTLGSIRSSYDLIVISPCYMNLLAKFKFGTLSTKKSKEKAHEIITELYYKLKEGGVLIMCESAKELSLRPDMFEGSRLFALNIKKNSSDLQTEFVKRPLPDKTENV